MNTPEQTHAFSVELKRKDALKLVTVPSDVNSCTLLEGFLGKLMHAGFVEGSMLEIQGTNGIFRIDMKTEELKKLLQPDSKEVKE